MIKRMIKRHSGEMSLRTSHPPPRRLGGEAAGLGTVSSGLAGRSRAIWLLPTDDFQRALVGARDTPPGPKALYLLLSRGSPVRRASMARRG
jgi:hypothetical protein